MHEIFHGMRIYLFCEQNDMPEKSMSGQYEKDGVLIT